MMKKKKGTPHTFYYNIQEKKYKLVFKQYPNGKKPEYINKSKIIMTYSNGNKKAHLYPEYFSKEMGSTSNTMYQEVSHNDNKENIITLLNSDLIYFLLKITQYSEPPNYKNEFKILNMIAKPNIGSLKTIEDIYKYYGITKDEKDTIKSIIMNNKPISSKTRKNKSKTPQISKTSQISKSQSRSKSKTKKVASGITKNNIKQVNKKIKKFNITRKKQQTSRKIKKIKKITKKYKSKSFWSFY